MPDPPTPVTQRLEWTTFGDDAGVLYERYMVPAIFGSWAEDLVRAGQCKHGDRVLDVACGTGVVARCAVQRVGRSGHVVGLDLSPAMLAAARSAAREASIEWREGSALAMPFSDRSFDVVLCQQGLQFFPDRAAALRQMRRVLAIGGRLVLSVFRTSEGHLALAEGLAPVLGATASSILEPFVLADADELRSLAVGAGFEDIQVDLAVRTAHFAEPESFMIVQASGRLASAVSKLTASERNDLFDRARAALRPYTDTGGLAFSMEANVLTARAS
jgi:SAM-dependent methyltransferase